MTSINLLISRGTAAALVLAASVSAAAPHYRFSSEMDGGGKGQATCLSLDAPTHHLYVGYADQIVCIDLVSQKPVGIIKNTSSAHCFAIAPGHQFGYFGKGSESRVYMINLRNFSRIKAPKAGHDPAAIVYEPSQDQLFAFDGSSHFVKSYEADDGDYLKTIPLPGTPSGAVSAPNRDLVYCNIKDKDEVAVIDGRKLNVSHCWSTAPGKSPFGLAINAGKHQLVIGCANLLVVMDSESGAVLGSVKTDGEIGDIACDPGTGLIFCASGNSVIVAAPEESSAQFGVVQTLAAAPGNRLMALDPINHKIYFPRASMNTQNNSTIQVCEANDN